MDDPRDSVQDDELLLRRIPVSQVGAVYEGPDGYAARPDAFHPHKTDHDGLSVNRDKSAAHPEFFTPEELAALGRSPRGYFVAVLRAGDLRAAGLEVKPDPEVEGGVVINPGHALLPQLNASNRRSNEVVEWKQMLALKLTLKVLGPFGPRQPA